MNPLNLTSLGIRTALGWLALPVICALQFVDMRHSVYSSGRSLLSIDVVLYSLVILFGLPWTIRELRRIRPILTWVVLPFIVIACYAAISALVTKISNVFFLEYSSGVPIIFTLHPTRAYLVMPAVMALLALGAGFSAVAVAPPSMRLRQLWLASATILLTSYLSWFKYIQANGTLRLGAGIGGAAVIFDVFLLTLAVFLASYSYGLWRKASVVGAGLSLLAVLLSGSRSGLICLALFATIVLVGLFNRGTIPRIAFWGVIGAVAAFAVLILLEPEARRLLSFGDELRLTNLNAAWAAWTASPNSIIWGQGFGHIWPWYLYEASQVGFSPRLITTEWGYALPHAHSTVISVLAELGIVGGLILLVMIFGIIRLLFRARIWGRPSFIMAAGATSTVVSWLFDTFLIKNYPIAFWWWYVLFAVFGFAVFVHTTNQDQPKAAIAAS